MLKFIDIGALARKTMPALAIAGLLGAMFYVYTLFAQPGMLPAPASVVLQQYLVMAITSNHDRSFRVTDDARGNTYFSIDSCGPDGACKVTLTLPKSALDISMETGAQAATRQRQGDAFETFVDVAVRYDLEPAPLGRFKRGTVPDEFSGLVASAAGGKIIGVRTIESSKFGSLAWELRAFLSDSLPFAVPALFVVAALLLVGPRAIGLAIVALFALLPRAFLMGVVFAPWF